MVPGGLGAWIIYTDGREPWPRERWHGAERLILFTCIHSPVDMYQKI